MQTILAIDPGTTRSGYVIWNPEGPEIRDRGEVDNEELLTSITTMSFSMPWPRACAIEMVAHYGTGMAVGAEVFETCVWIGKFSYAWKLRTLTDPMMVYRRQVKMFLCGSMQAKDGNIRQAIIDRLGPPGKKSCPGVTYGISKHLWSALAVALAAESNAPTAT